MKRRLSLAKNIALSNFKRLDFPYKLTFVTTYSCNYRCKTCSIWERRPKDELTLDEIRRFFRKSSKFNWIDFTGGEPWLRKDFPDVVEAALEFCPDLFLVHFPTNGWMTDQIVAGVKRIMERRPPKLIVTVSTDGDEAVNDEVRGMKGGWKRQLETFKRLREIPGVEAVLGMTLSPHNALAYDAAFAAAKAECPDLTPKDYHLNLAHESSHYYGNEGALKGRHDSEEEILAQIAAYRRARGVPMGVVDYLENRYLKKVEGFVRGGRTPMRCHALSSSCFVDSWGNVYPCAMYDAKIAGLREHDYDLGAIWKLKKTRELQKDIWDYKCPQCWTPCEAYQSILGNLFGLRNSTSAR